MKHGIMKNLTLPLDVHTLGTCLVIMLVVILSLQGSESQQNAAPEILSPMDDLRVADGGAASFVCLVAGRPLPQVTWWKSGKQLNTNRQRFLAINISEANLPQASGDGGSRGGVVLRIEPVRAGRDEGRYECRVSNGMEPAALVSANMDIYRDAQSVPQGFPKILTGPSIKAVEQGQSTTLRCAAEGTPTPEVMWLKDFIPIHPDGKRIQLQNSGTLKITEIDSEDEGKYECLARNTVGSVYSYAANLYVRVRRAPPHFSIPPDPVYEVMPGGSVNLTCIAIGSPMPHVIWRRGLTEVSTDIKHPIGRNVLSLTGVTQSATYTCIAESDIGRVETQAEVKVKALPRPPVNLNLLDVTSRSAKVAWRSETGDTGETYVVEYSRKHQLREEPTVIHDVTGTVYNLLGLTPYTSYEIKVFTVNNIGKSTSSNSIDISTLEDERRCQGRKENFDENDGSYTVAYNTTPSSPPQHVRARPASGSTVVVQWEEPKQPNGVIQGYRIFYTRSSDVSRHVSSWLQQTSDSSQLTTIGNLATNETYALVILAFTRSGDGPMSEPIFVKTQLGVPEQPRNLRAYTTTSHSIGLLWETPDTSGEPLLSYELYYNDTDYKQNVHVTITPPSTSYTMSDLTANTLYNIRVSAKTSRGEGAYSNSIAVRTKQTAPSGPPQSVRAEPLNSTSFRVTWRPPIITQQNGVLTGYRLLWGEAGSSKGPDEPQRVSLGSGEFSYIVVDAMKWTVYNVWVQALSESGEGPLSDVIIVQTMEDVPGEPRKVKIEAINSTAVRVQWRSPAERELNGVIRGFQIYYTQIDEQDNPVGQTQMRDIMNGNEQEAVVTDLAADTWYDFQMSAYTRRGDGARSRSKKIKTKGAVLSAPRNLQLTLSQEEPPVVLVTWQAPSGAVTSILGYKVEYQIRGLDSMEEKLLGPDKYRFTSTFLDRGVEYEFRVSAKNEVDFGEWAFGRISTPEGIPAGSPLNFTVVKISSDSVKLRWEPPSLRHRNGHIDFYDIMYHKARNYIDHWTTNTSDTWVTVEALEPARQYFFQIRACTSKGCGPWSGQMDVHTTGQSIIFPPSNIQARRVSRTVMEVRWDRPSTAGVIGYEVHYGSWTKRSPRSADQGVRAVSSKRWAVKEVNGGTSTEIKGLDPENLYMVKVRTKLTDGRLSDFSEPVVEEDATAAAAPHQDRVEGSSDAVLDLRARKITTRSVRLEWSTPNKGGIFYYKVTYNGTKSYYDSEGVERMLNDSHADKVVGKERTSLTLEDLVPNTPYIFTVSANFVDGIWGPPSSVIMETDVDVPSEVRTPQVERIVSESTALLKLKEASSINGPISFYYVVVVPLDQADRRLPDEFRTPELIGADVQSGHEPWIAAMFTRLPGEMLVGDARSSGTGKFYNRPLDKTRLYRVFLRAYVRDGNSTSSQYSEMITTDALIGAVPYQRDLTGTELLWIVAPVCGAVVLILLLVLIIVYLRRRRIYKEDKIVTHSQTKLIRPQSAEVTSPYSSDPVDLRRRNYQTPGYTIHADCSFNSFNSISRHKRIKIFRMANHPPIPVMQLADVMEHFKARGGEGFAREYESIEPGQPFTWDASSAEVNKNKNRYANVVAYDHSRVVLKPIDDIPGSEYINANFMDGYCRHNAYIATQGPLNETAGDFWRMVWEQQSSVIVMMTKLEERNRIKCDQYWPSKGLESYGVMQVAALDIIELAYYTIRTFQLGRLDSGEKREIRHLQYTAWPDHGVPDFPNSLLSFIRRVKALTPNECGPVIVHCSAGVGRTGTYIVIDSMLDRLRHENTVDIYGHVTCLRSQRNYMVQTEEQYIFIYDSVLEAVQSGNTELPADNLFMHIQQISQFIESTNITGIELEFQKLNYMKINPNQFVCANLPANKNKNRMHNILPYDSTRVSLQPIRGVEGSDYINASFIDGYRYRRSYIAAQGPTIETTEDFWRLLWEQSSSIVVMLTKVKELGREKCYQYWPEERSARYQYFVVDPIAQYNMPLYVLREFKVTDARDGQSRIIRQFQLTDWPEQGVPASGEGFIEFIGHVQKTKDQFGQDGPITVHCCLGAGRTGVFITLSIVLERMRCEGLIDLYQTVKLLRTQRPGLIQTEGVLLLVSRLLPGSLLVKTTQSEDKKYKTLDNKLNECVLIRCSLIGQKELS